MRAQKWKIAALVLVRGGWWSSCAWGDVAATVNVDYPVLAAHHEQRHSGTPTSCYGWRFFVDKQITITHLGLFGVHGNDRARLWTTG